VRRPLAVELPLGTHGAVADEFVLAVVIELDQRMLRSMRHVTIQTGRRSFMLEHDDALRLLEHVQRDGGVGRPEAERPLLHAINDRGSADVRWSAEGKRGALNALAAWIAADGILDMPEVIQQLLRELTRDLGVPPFDAT
jgi:hypothetical protein